MCVICLQSWGTELDTNNSRIHDFLEQLEKFVNSLEGARGNMEGHVTLADTDIGFMLDAMRSASDYQAAGLSIMLTYICPILRVQLDVLSYMSN